MDLEIKNKTLYSGIDGTITESISNYPASLYSLQVLIKEESSNAVSLTVEEDGDDFVIAYTIDQLTFGNNKIQYVFTNKTTSEVDVEEFIITIKPLLTSSADTRSEDEKTLALLKEARIKIAGRDYTEVSINGKSTTFKSLLEIERAICRLETKMGIRQTPQLINSF